uniref:Cysteine--tRNA ligase, cytoplasmic n=1 Tax=Romanomermis culicivorax TaxID=13658 RepID=A0A915JLD0_ROMCU
FAKRFLYSDSVGQIKQHYHRSKFCTFVVEKDMANTQVKANGSIKENTWTQPCDKAPKLKLLNSLTKKKEIFVPQNGNEVKWYICGPTVYDAAHMGHARSYISFDILRRIMQNYFNYEVLFVMNITDIDDKIIKRARHRYLMYNYTKNGLKVEKVISDAKIALSIFKKRYEAETNAEKKIMLDSMLTKVYNTVSELEQNLRGKNEEKIDSSKKCLLDDAWDVLADWLDGQFGATVTDHSIFSALARRFEDEFYSDMADLNVLPPDVVTRVSEFVPEIITFIEKIIKNGYAYESNSSVYFDTAAFNACPNHRYAKLLPDAYDEGDTSQTNALREAEGELTDTKQEKKNTRDFALWKASKAGEPCWPSPWGQGRPGWHIECSVMATETCGTSLDIHGGGYDLKFPHHDNEIAQTEACFESDQWVNYFLHTGMLRIAGLKMSKSLKNFITIKDVLKEYTARQLRILFLLHNWDDVLDYSASTMAGALQFEKMLNEFLLAIKFYTRQRFDSKKASSFPKYDATALELNGKFYEAKSKIREALCDSIDTKSTMEIIRELISQTNIYVCKKNSQHEQFNICLVKNIADYISSLMKIFGIDCEACSNVSLTANNNNNTCQNMEEVLMPWAETIANFRERVRNINIGKKSEEAHASLIECDKIRNEILPQFGVRLEDREGHTMVKFCDPEELMREKKQEAEQREKMRLEKEKKKAEQEARLAKRRIPPQELFRNDPDVKYSHFDDKGIPTHDEKGTELSKGARKKLEKVYALQEQKYGEYLKSLSSNSAESDSFADGSMENDHSKENGHNKIPA